MRNIAIIGLVAVVLYLLYKSKQATAPQPARIPFGSGFVSTTPIDFSTSQTINNSDLENRLNQFV